MRLVVRFLVGLIFLAVFFFHNEKGFKIMKDRLKASGSSAFIVTGIWLLKKLKFGLDITLTCLFCYFCFFYVIRPIFEGEAPHNYTRRIKMEPFHDDPMKWEDICHGSTTTHSNGVTIFT